MKTTRSIVLTALMLAVNLVLPPLSRAVGMGSILSVMHIPVYLAGICIGPVEGFITGLFSPLLNHLLYGLPAVPGVFAMSVELPVYGLVSGLCMRLLKGKVKNDTLRVYFSLILAMLAGRAAGGLMYGLILQAGSFTFAGWISLYFIGTMPGIILHLILVPMIYLALHKAKLA